VTLMDRAMTASAMSTSIAHELNQPLSAILNNAEAAEMLLSASSPDRDQLKEILADIRGDDLRAVGIIKHLRMLLKQGELEPQDIDLTEVVNDTLVILEPQALEQGVTLQVEPLPANLRVRADSVHIQQVLFNLAMNAIDAMRNMPAGGRKLMLQVIRRNTDVMVSLSDTGSGIPEAKLKSIFEPFVTTKQQGTGLGLSIARTIIGTYGGTIWAENRAGGGAIFRFTLNLTGAETA
jgi:C4-dicarboxylate-specific signal transduction histidine kinase